MRRKGENCITLKSGHKLFYKGNEEQKLGGVGILINKTEAVNITQYHHAISERVIAIDIKINKRYTCKIIQVYAPTTGHKEEEIETFYEHINEALNKNKTKYTIIMGDFNAKVGKQEDPNEQGIGPFGLGTRNSRGNRLVDYISEKKPLSNEYIL